MVSTLSKNITIAGIGMGNPDLLTKETRCALIDADLIIGARRMRDAIPKNCHAEYKETYDGREIMALVEETDAENIVICMSGDSGFYSGTKGLLAMLEGKYEVNVLPGISSISYLSAKSGISWQDACIMSLHGRKDNWIQAVRSHEKTFLLMGNDSLRSIVEELCLAELGHCVLVIGIKLSYPDEMILKGKASTLLDKGDKLECWDSGLCVLFVLNDRAGEQKCLGIPDDDFIRGQVPMTKSEVRAVTMSRLNLREDSVVYDIGAGTGSVSIEMALHAYRGSVYAVECMPKALELITANKAKFMADNLEIVEGKAPDCLEHLPDPDAVFIGGSKGEKEQIIKAVLGKNPKAHFVCNIISLESLSEMLSLIEKYQLKNLEITQISAARGHVIGNQHLMEGLNPVFVVSFEG